MSKKIDLPQETIDKLLKNEFQMDSVGTDTLEISMVEPKEQNVTDSSEEEIVVESIEYNDIKFPTRGFNSLEEAIEFMHKPYFKGLGKADKDEYINWLIKK